MAVLDPVGPQGGVAVLAAAQAVPNGAGPTDSTNTAVRSGGRATLNPAAVVITNTAGGTPAITVNIQGSVDGVNFFNIPYALVGSPSTFTQAAISLTTTATNAYLLQPNQPWRFLKLVFSTTTSPAASICRW